MKRLVRGSLELREIVAQVRDFIYRTFTFNRMRVRESLAGNQSNVTAILTENILYNAGIGVGSNVNVHAASRVHQEH